ncbi:MAG: alpha-L-fucosidase, partial [Pirellulales bacterium]|nr:alpha-L-fucosidase [Pirellulales bacterium]
DAAKALDGRGDTHWTTPENVTTGTLEIDLDSPVKFDRAMLQEQIAEGQRVEKFELDAFVNGQWKTIAKATTIGYKRLLRFPEVTAAKVRLRILQSRDCPTIRRFGLFKASTEESEAK